MKHLLCIDTGLKAYMNYNLIQFLNTLTRTHTHTEVHLTREPNIWNSDANTNNFILSFNPRTHPVIYATSPPSLGPKGDSRTCPS